jgi:hypothetical protein
MVQQFQKEIIDFAATVEKRWGESNFNLDVFPELSAQALRSFSLKSGIPDIESLTKEIKDMELPQQTFPRGEFSDFSLTFVRTEKLLVDIYIWFKSDTAIHNHHFCGAFKVIAGHSYQVNYDFEIEKNICPGIDQGVMKEVGNQHLNENDVIEIRPRDQFIHHVFHLGKPTVTLCLRTPFFSGEYLSTFIYPKYRVELNPISNNQAKWLQVIGLTLSQDPESHPEVVWSDGDIIRMLFMSYNNQIHLSLPVVNYLLNYLEKRSFLPDFFELLKSQSKLNEKLKKFASNYQQTVELIERNPESLYQAVVSANLTEASYYFRAPEDEFRPSL